jgi:beta-lactamase regulating signal transducer with metallopeptidase domain
MTPATATRSLRTSADPDAGGATRRVVAGTVRYAAGSSASASLPGAGVPAAAALPASAPRATQDPRAWLVTLWAVGALVVLAWLAAGLLRARALTRGARPVADPAWHAQADQVRSALSLRRPVALLRCNVPIVPMTWGRRRPVVLLPADADAWSPARRRQVLLHELAHVQRDDWTGQILAHLACALFWYHPLAWLAARALRRERELACDDQVLCAGGLPSDYAGHLLEIARTRVAARGTGVAALAMARRSQLEGRLLAVLDGRRPRGRLARRHVAAAVLLALAIVLPLACVQPEPAPPVDVPAATAHPADDGVVATRTPAVTSGPTASHGPSPAGGPSAAHGPAPASPSPGPGGVRSNAPAPPVPALPPVPAVPPVPRVPPLPPVPSLPSVPTPAPHASHATHTTMQVSHYSSNGSDMDFEGFVQTHSSEHGTVSMWRWTDADGRSWRAEIRGELGLTDDDRGVAWIEDGGSLVVEREGYARVHVMPGEDGEPTLVGSLDGRKADEPELRDALAELLPHVVRHTGLAASERVERLHAAGGAPAVLEEIERLGNDHARDAYYGALLEERDVPRDDRLAAAVQAARLLEGAWARSEFVTRHGSRYMVAGAGGTLDEPLADALLAVAVGIRSDAYLAEALGVLLADHLATPALTARILVAARDIGSDAYAAELLAEAGTAPLRDPEAREAWLDVVATISSDAYMTELLADLIGDDETTPELAARILSLAAGEIASDAYMAELLTETSHAALAVEGVRAAWMEALESVSSDAYACEIVLELVEASGGAAGPLVQALDLAGRTIDSDAYLAEVLLDVPRSAFGDGAVLQAYLRAAGTISSRVYREEVMEHLPPDKRPEQA